MPVYLDSNILSTDKCTSNFIASFDSLKERSLEFLSTFTKRDFCSLDKVLYVSQREHATVSRKDKTLNFVGSGDATTCHIVVLISENAISVGHFDGCDTENGLLRMLEENNMLNRSEGNGNKRSNSVLLAHIFGGFVDDRNLSKRLLDDILLIMSHVEHEIHLVTACVYSLNTRIIDGKNHPIIYGVAIDMKTSQIVPASFSTKGPCEVLRSARIFGSCSQMFSIYNNESKLVEIGPFNYQVFRGAEMVLKFDDNKILEILSTSPHCEPEDFASNTRKAIQFLLEHPVPKEIFKDWKTLTFKISETGSWIQEI